MILHEQNELPVAGLFTGIMQESPAVLLLYLTTSVITIHPTSAAFHQVHTQLHEQTAIFNWSGKQKREKIKHIIFVFSSLHLCVYSVSVIAEYSILYSVFLWLGNWCNLIYVKMVKSLTHTALHILHKQMHNTSPTIVQSNAKKNCSILIDLI